MNRVLPLLLGAALLPAATQAQVTGAQIYGQLHVSADYLDTDSRGSALNLSSNASRLGFRGKYEVQEQLTVVWQAETTLRVDSQGGDLIDRDTFLGLTGDWGLLRVGKFDTPMKVLRNRTDIFPNQIGDARNITRNRVAAPAGLGSGQIGWDERFRNSIHYRTPTVAGLTANAQYSTSLDSASSNDADAGSWSASVEWRLATFWIAVAHENQTYTDDVLPEYERHATRVAALYDIGDFRFSALYQKAEDPDDAAWGAGVRYRVTEKVALKTQYYHLDADADDSDADLYALGADYQVAPNLTFYANYAVLDNDALSNLRPYSQARTADPASLAGNSPSGFSLGTVFSF